MRTSRSGNEDGNRGALFILAQVIQNGITEPGNARRSEESGNENSVRGALFILAQVTQNGITEPGNVHEGQRARETKMV